MQSEFSVSRIELEGDSWSYGAISSSKVPEINRMVKKASVRCTSDSRQSSLLSINKYAECKVIVFWYNIFYEEETEVVFAYRRVVAIEVVNERVERIDD